MPSKLSEADKFDLQETALPANECQRLGNTLFGIDPFFPCSGRIVE